ncbi:GNAT family N-acetyltransferase [Ramlibacter sp. PS3R-8]|uniref:GNAT family N-acetyltransferase n=1 Tax=Ramlibacter sp. PS3R-8 TaxID=3133437 RepID=UPI0030AA0402
MNHWTKVQWQAADPRVSNGCASNAWKTMISRDITLRDGRVLHVRDSSLADEAELLQKFGRMSENDRYMRLMRVVRTPNMEYARSLLASLPQAGIGLVATVPAADGIDIVGSALAVFAKDRPSCEFATAVDAGYAGAGLASALMRLLMAEARRRGMQEMEGFVLSQNQPMLRLARRLGFSASYDPDDASVRICRKSLDEEITPTGPA